MVTNSQINAAPGEIIIADRRFIVRPLREKDYAELEAWVQDRHISTTRRNLKGLTPKQQQTLLDRVFDEATKMQLTSPEALRILASPEGAFRMLHLALRRDQPDLALEDICDLIGSDPKEIDRVMEKIGDVERRATPRPKVYGHTRPRKRARKKAKK